MRETQTKWGCIALITSSGDNAVKQIKIQGYQPEVILSDYRLQEGKNGVEAIHQVYQVMEKKVPAMIITGDTDRERLREASDSGYT